MTTQSAFCFPRLPRHLCSDVFEVDPQDATQGRPVGLLWASPDSKSVCGDTVWVRVPPPAPLLT